MNKNDDIVLYFIKYKNDTKFITLNGTSFILNLFFHFIFLFLLFAQEPEEVRKEHSYSGRILIF